MPSMDIDFSELERGTHEIIPAQDFHSRLMQASQQRRSQQRDE